MLTSRDEKDFVIRLYYRRALRNDGVTAAAENSSDPGVHSGHVFSNFLQLTTNDWSPCQRSDRD